MNMEADSVVAERPVVATVLVAVVATVAYVAIQLVLDGSVSPVETAVFTAVFTLVYVGGNYLLQRNGSEEEVAAEAAENATDENATERDEK